MLLIVLCSMNAYTSELLELGRADAVSNPKYKLSTSAFHGSRCKVIEFVCTACSFREWTETDLMTSDFGRQHICQRKI